MAATLLSKAQADAIKASNNDSLPTWAYENSQYWLGFAYDSNNVLNVNFDGDVYSNYYGDVDFIGVRPVITIAKSDL